MLVIITCSMKAAQINKYGGSEVIEINEVPKPQAVDGTVVVEVFAASVNPIDWKIRSGYMAHMMPIKFPSTLGTDFSGVVAELGKGVDFLRVGDEVYGQGLVAGGGSGAFAEYVCAPAKSIAKKPKNVSHLEAAALPLAGVSALQGLLEHMNLQRGQRILIHGGAGGIGTFAIELAKYIGAEVFTTAHREDEAYLKGLGASHIIDYRTEKFEDVVHDCDAVFDTVGGDIYTRSFGVLKRGGVIVSLLEPPHKELMEKYGVTAISQFTHTTRPHLEKLTELVQKNVTKVHVDKIFPLNQVAAALDYLKNEHQRGKVVLKVK